MPFCSYCGKELNADIKFCPNCGNKNISTGSTESAPMMQEINNKTNYTNSNHTVQQENPQKNNINQENQNPVPNQPVKLDKSKNNLFAWLMATVPVTGIILGFFLPFGGWTCLILNILLGYFDSSSLKKQGVDTSEFGGLAFLVPYYLYKRATALGDNLAYFIVWIILFALTIFI